MADIDPDTLLEWLTMGTGEERDMQVIALEQLCMLLLMSDNVDRCFERFVCFFLPFFFDFFFLISLYELVVNILDTLWQIIRSLGILISCWIYCNIPKIYHLIISLSLKRSWREENFGQPFFLRGLHNIF